MSYWSSITVRQHWCARRLRLLRRIGEQQRGWNLGSVAEFVGENGTAETQESGRRGGNGGLPPDVG